MNLIILDKIKLFLYDNISRIPEDRCASLSCEQKKKKRKENEKKSLS